MQRPARRKEPHTAASRALAHVGRHRRLRRRSREHTAAVGPGKVERLPLTFPGFAQIALPVKMRLRLGSISVDISANTTDLDLVPFS